LQYIYNQTNSGGEGKMISLASPRPSGPCSSTLAALARRDPRLQDPVPLYTVPGQVFYDREPQADLKGVDGVVYVGDSQLERNGSEHRRSTNLRQNLHDAGL